MNLKTLSSLPLEGKRVIVRVDFNVPLNKEGEITDDTRIRAAIPTIKTILEKGGSVILLSHLGRPKGKKDPAYSLRPVAPRLAELLQQPVHFVGDCVGTSVQNATEKLAPKEILLLENLRYYLAEEKPDTDPSFAKKLADLGDAYVNDAFGTAHRKHSSTYFIAEHFPENSAAGLLIEKEVEAIDKLLHNPEHPFYAIIGGAKISTKIGVLSSLADLVDALFIGGAMAYTFFKSKRIAIGNSLCEDEHLTTAKEFLEKCEKMGVTVHLPEDIVITQNIAPDSETQIIDVKEGIPDGFEGVDIGPKTREKWKKLFTNGKTFFWNGPVGVFEIPQFAGGTKEIAEALASQKNALTIVGGGDSLAAVNQLSLGEYFSHLSTGGGASLEFLQYGHLPGIDILQTR